MFRENVRHAVHGLVVLPILLAGIALGIWSFVLGVQAESLPRVLLSVGIVLLFLIGLAGLFMVQPNQGRVLQLFGDYRGTVRAPGLRWANPSTASAASRCACATSTAPSSR